MENVPAGEIAITKTTGDPAVNAATDVFTVTCGAWGFVATREQLSQIASRIRSAFLQPPPTPNKTPRLPQIQRAPLPTQKA
jgi:hypothetical protein